MKGIVFALLGGFFLTFQSVANAVISEQIGSWQAAAMTQLTGFVLAVMIVFMLRDRSIRELKNVPPLYASGGLLAAVILFSNMTAIHLMGVTLTISIFLIAQLVAAIVIDKKGWLDVAKKKVGTPQVVGVCLMVLGLVVLKW